MHIKGLHTFNHGSGDIMFSESNGIFACQCSFLSLGFYAFFFFLHNKKNYL